MPLPIGFVSPVTYVKVFVTDLLDLLKISTLRVSVIRFVNTMVRNNDAIDWLSVAIICFHLSAESVNKTVIWGFPRSFVTLENL